MGQRQQCGREVGFQTAGLQKITQGVCHWKEVETILGTKGRLQRLESLPKTHTREWEGEITKEGTRGHEPGRTPVARCCRINGSNKRTFLTVDS